MTEVVRAKKEGLSKWIAPLTLALVTGVMGGAGTAIYKHELAILKNARLIERLTVKDYRQHRDGLRHDVAFFADAVNTLEAVLEIDPEVFGPNSNLVLKTRKAQLSAHQELLENYVEENKHGGRED